MSQEIQETPEILVTSDSSLSATSSPASSTKAVLKADAPDVIEIDTAQLKRPVQPVEKFKSSALEIDQTFDPSSSDGIDIDTSHYVGRKLLMIPQSAEFVVNNYTIGNQTQPRVATAGDGSFIITWTSNGQDGSEDGVYAQRFNASAARLGSEFRVNNYTASNQNLPDIQIKENGEFIVTWTSNQDIDPVVFPMYETTGTCDQDQYYYPTGYICGNSCQYICSPTPITTFNANRSSLGVYIQSFSNNATKINSEIKQSTYSFNHQQTSSVQIINNENFLVVWESSASVTYSCNCNSYTMYSSPASQDGSGFGIFARLLSSNGNPFGVDFQINTYVANDQRYPVVGAFTDSSSVIVWQSSNAQDSSGWGIFGQRITATGTKLGSEFFVNNYLSGDQINPDVGTFSTGQFVVVWQSAAQDGSGYGIYGRLFDASANPGNEFRVNTNITNDQINPDVATFNTGEFVVVWQSMGQDGSGYGICGQRFSAEGLPYGSEFQLNTYTSNNQTNPSVATFADGGFVVTWESMGQDTSGSAVVAQVYKNLPLPTLSMGQLDIVEDSSTQVTSSIFSVSGDHPLTQLKIIISNLQQGSFSLAPFNTSVTQFSQQAILDGLVYFVHDRSEFAPSFNVSASDGFAMLAPIPANISYTPVNDPPIITHNAIAVAQGQTVLLDANYLEATDSDSSVDQLNFTIRNLQHGVFRSLILNTTITSFLQSNITDGDIIFIHDGSTTPPAYDVSASDGQLTAGPQSAAVAFNGFAILNNQLSIAEGQAVVLTINNLQAITSGNTPASQLTFIASNIQHGQFERLSFPTVAITTFNLQEIQFNTIRFVHDGSENAPSYDVALSDGTISTSPRAAVITYTPVNNMPVLGNNTLTIGEGGTTVLTGATLSATDRDNPASALTFTVSQVQQGRFELLNNTGRSINSFVQQQVTDGQVQFVHDGGEIAPSYAVSVSDGSLSTLPQAATVIYTPVNDAPRILLNQLTISEGASVILSTAQLQIEDPDNAPSELVITPSAIQAGRFEQVFDPGIPLNSFTYQSVQSGFIRFVHDGSETPAGYTLTVSDGSLSSTAVPAVITYIPVNDPPTLTMNRLAIEEGETVTLTSAQLAATDPDDPVEDLVFTVSQVQTGRFEDLNTGASILSFAQQNIQAGEIAFSHDSSETAPVYFVSVSDGQLSSPAQQAVINFTSVNDAPEIVTNTLTIIQGQSVLLTSADLRAEDAETPSDDLLLTVSNLSHGRFEYVADPGHAVSIFSQSKIKTADIRFVSDGSTHTPSYQVQVSDGELSSNASTAVVNFNLASDQAKASGLSTRDLVSLFSSLGSIGLTLAGYIWWRSKTAEHRRGHDFANYLRKLLNLEYYDFTKGQGDIYKTKVNNLVERINSRNDDFYAKLTPPEREAFALCVAGFIVQKQLLQRSESASGLFNWLLCFSVGWSNQLKLKEMDKALTTIGDEAVTAWKAEAAPLERWNYKPRGARAKISAFFATKNCKSSQPQSEVLEEVRRASEYKSTGKVELLTEEVELSTYHQAAQTPKTGVSGMKASSAAGRGLGQGAGLFDRSEVTALRQDLTAVQEKLDAVLVHLGQPKQ